MLHQETSPLFDYCDIFASINFRAFPKIANFARINIHDFDIFASMWHYTCYFHDVHIFADI